MAKPMRWPNNMMKYRDGAAQDTQAAIRLTKQLLKDIQRGNYTRHGLEVALLHIQNRQLSAIRYLEKADARTEPD